MRQNYTRRRGDRLKAARSGPSASILCPRLFPIVPVRYERHRVWEVEGKLKAGQRHIYDKRTFFIDEDTWQIALADHYDARGELWRVSAAYQLNFYNDLVPWMTAEAIHDLQSRRYLVSGLSNETPSEASFGHEALRQDFKPDALRRLGGKN